MTEFEGSEVVRRSPEEVFSFVSDVANLPLFLPTTRVAERVTQDRVHVAGTALGRPYDGEGFFRARPGERRVEWGSERYAGWLQVDDLADGSEVTLHVSVPTGAATTHGIGDEREIADRAIADTLRQLRAEVEGAAVGLEP